MDGRGRGWSQKKNPYSSPKILCEKTKPPDFLYWGGTGRVEYIVSMLQIFKIIDSGRRITSLFRSLFFHFAPRSTIRSNTHTAPCPISLPAMARFALSLRCALSFHSFAFYLFTSTRYGSAPLAMVRYSKKLHFVLKKFSIFEATMCINTAKNLKVES